MRIEDALELVGPEKVAEYEQAILDVGEAKDNLQVIKSGIVREAKAGQVRDARAARHAAREAAREAHNQTLIDMGYEWREVERGGKAYTRLCPPRTPTQAIEAEVEPVEEPKAKAKPKAARRASLKRADAVEDKPKRTAVRKAGKGGLQLGSKKG